MKDYVKIFRRRMEDLKLIDQVLDAPTYYPEAERKSREERKKDLIDWLHERGEANEHYNVWGLDVKGADPSLFLDYSKSFRRERDRLNRRGRRGSVVGIMEDKYMFYKTMKGFGLPVPEVFAYINNGVFFDASLHPITIDDLKDRKDYFLKDAYGMKGKEVLHIKDHAGLLAVKDKLAKGDYILQERIVASEEAGRLYSGSINTIRIITVRQTGEEPKIFARFQRMGSLATGNVDNWSSGGVAAGIKDDGHLKDMGYYRFDTPGGRTEKHPDSGITFASYRIPDYDKALELALEAHRHFHNLFSCGWDVAITKDGPVMVEGNDCWGSGSPQVCDRPLKKEWDELVREYDRRTK